jgi:hypothetical protein
MRARAACVIRLTVAGNGDAQDVEVFSAIGDPVMNPATQLKRGSAVFTVFWIAGMLWWSGSLAPGNVIATTVCGLIVGYAWYRVMRWQLARGRLPPGPDTGSAAKP